MSEQEPKRIVNVDEKGEVISRRVHRYDDCSMLDTGDFGVKQSRASLTERERILLGISECKVCLKRAEGGPALQALTEILNGELEGSVHDEEGLARSILDEMKRRGFYVSQRAVKS